MTDVGFPAALEFQAAVLHDPVFASHAGSGFDRNQVGPRLLHSLHSKIGDIGADHAVAVTGVDENPRGLDVELFIEAGADGGEIVVLDVTDFADGDGIERDDGQRLRAALDDEGADIEWVIVEWDVSAGDIDFGCSGTELSCRCFVRGENAREQHEAEHASRAAMTVR